MALYRSISLAIILYLAATSAQAVSAQAESLSLKDALAKAVANNPLLTEGRLGVASSEQNVVSAFGKHYPRFSLDGNLTQRQDPFPYIPAQSAKTGPHFSDSFAFYTIQMSVPIYQGGQIVNGVALAEVRKQLQEQSLYFTRNEIIANSVNTYNKLLQLQKLKDASQSSVTALEEQVKNSRLSLELGRIARVDLLKVDVQLANERQRLLSLEESIITLAATLQYLMGEPPKGEVLPTLTSALDVPQLEADFVRALESAQLRRPEYLSAVEGVKEADFSRKITQGRFLPTVSAVAGYLDQFGFNPWYKEANWFTGINLSIPIFDKPLLADLSRDRIQKERSQARLTAVGNQIRLDIQTGLTSLRESKKRIEVAQGVLGQAQESFRIEQEKYNSGAGVMVDLLLAQSAEVNAVANYTQSLYDYNAAVVAYRRATGTLEEYLQ